MTSQLLGLLIAVLSSPLGEGEAAELRYQGSLAPVTRENVGEPVKRFNLFCLLKRGEGGSHSLAFVLDERGGGGWAWPERYGLLSLDGQNQPLGQIQIRLLYDHKGENFARPIPQPLFEFADKLEAEAKWAVDDHEYEVTGSRTLNDRDCWQVEVEQNFGRRATIWVEKTTSLVVTVEQRLFVGQGEEFLLKMDLDAIEPIDAERLARFQKPLDTLIALQAKLKRGEATRSELTAAQLQAASEVAEQLRTEAEETPFSRLVSVIDRDVKSQLQRVDDVSNLAKKFVGQKLPNIELTSLAGKTIAPEEHNGKILVLHFWSYQGEPMPEEPFGQVGYLDFTNSRRRKLGVKIYGVAVNERLADASQKPAALRSVRKLKDFMNLSYDVTYDAGGALKKFGDPERLGAKLPLWIVAAPDGTIAHYHVGFYDINPDEGLRVLDEVLVELIKKQKAGSE